MNTIRASRLDRLVRGLWLAVWMALIAYLGMTLWLGVTGLMYPYQLDYGEGIVLWFAQQLARGQGIYKDLASAPYASSNYPPVAMGLAAILMRFMGEGYLAGRLVNFAAALGAAAMIYRIVHVESGQRRLGAIAALFFIGSPYIYDWVALFRADLIGLAFALGGVFCVWNWERRGKGADRNLAGATILFFLALYTKHTLVAGPAAAAIALWRRDRRLAAGFVLVLGAIGAVTYLALDLATGGGFSAGLILSNATVFLPSQLFALLKNAAVTFPILAMLAGVGWVRRAQARRLGVVEWYALVSCASVVMAGRMGAWENYFFEAIAGVCLVAFGSWPFDGEPWLAASSGRVSALGASAMRLAVPSILLVQVALMWHDPRIAAGIVATGAPANRELAALLVSTPGTILSEDMGALATSGKEVAYYTYQYSMLARSGKWDQSWELEGLSRGAFPLVILEQGTREDVDHYGRFTRQFVSALDRYYARTRTIGPYEIYTPAPLAHTESIAFGDALEMVGWTAELHAPQARDLKIAIVWQAKEKIGERYTAFVHLESAEGTKVAQDDHEPSGGVYPTNRWAPGEMVRDQYTLVLPADLPRERYRVRVGWYQSDSGDRLGVPGSADDAALVAVIDLGQ